jgi:hypothetical protein
LPNAMHLVSKSSHYRGIEFGICGDCHAYPRHCLAGRCNSRRRHAGAALPAAEWLVSVVSRIVRSVSRLTPGPVVWRRIRRRRYGGSALLSILDRSTF